MVNGKIIVINSSCHKQIVLSDIYEIAQRIKKEKANEVLKKILLDPLNKIIGDYI